MRRSAACLLLAGALFWLWGDASSTHASELLRIESSIHYAVDAESPAVNVTWDIHLQNNDPSTQFSQFYEAVGLPVLAGATNVSAVSQTGTLLSVFEVTDDVEVLDQVQVVFESGLFFGETYSFQLAYQLPETRDEAMLVTPAYVYVPLITLGDAATVTIDAPEGHPFQTNIDEQECASDGAALQCSGSEGVYLAGLLEVLRPDLVSTLDFEVALPEANVGVSLTYFQGEDAVAQHQRDVITQTLPLIADAYGWPYPGTPTFTVAHGGRQRIFGYEGIASCGGAECEIIISPVASDYTLVHELAHLWSGIYQERWLAEGFAEWITTQVTQSAPPGLLQGEFSRFPPAAIPLQLDEWDDAESIIGADDTYVELTQAGYDYSLRFIEELADEVGAEGLRDVNRAIVDSSLPVESRRYMDFLEDTTGLSPDDLFLLWVFPESTRPLIEERRATRNRHAAVASELAAGGFPDEPLAAVRDDISDWDFEGANSGLDEIDANLSRYDELKSDLEGLTTQADTSGLVLPASLASAVERWEFDEAETLMDSARGALLAYTAAEERVAKPRSLWQKFGLIGEDPEAELDEARELFSNAAFTRSAEHSQSAIDIVDGAGSAATRRVLVVVAILVAFAVALAIAYVIAVTRQRRFGEEG